MMQMSAAVRLIPTPKQSECEYCAGLKKVKLTPSSRGEKEQETILFSFEAID
jgi:hypothetical protein